jgi:hypothetical protein
VIVISQVRSARQSRASAGPVTETGPSGP